MLKFLARKIGSYIEWLVGLAFAFIGLMAVMSGGLAHLVSRGDWVDTVTIIGGFAVTILAIILMVLASERSEEPMTREAHDGWLDFWYHPVTHAITDALGTIVSAVFIAVVGAIVGGIVGFVLGIGVAAPSPLPWWSDGHAYMAGLVRQCAVAGAALLLALCAWETYGEVPYTHWRERHHAMV